MLHEDFISYRYDLFDQWKKMRNNEDILGLLKILIYFPFTKDKHDRNKPGISRFDIKKDLEKIPFTLLIKDCKVTFMEHKRAVVHIAVE